MIRLRRGRGRPTITGKPISQVLVEEVSGPLGVADELYFGMPAVEHHWRAKLEDALASGVMPDLPADRPMFRAAPPALFPNATLGSRPDILVADLPAGGKTSARMYAALLGEVVGVRLFTPERLREATAPLDERGDPSGEAPTMHHSDLISELV